MKKVFFIDPQGGSGNLGMYDYELLSRINNHIIYFFGSITYNYLPLVNINCRFWFNYITYKNQIVKGISYILTMVRIFFICFIIKPSVLHIQWIRIPIFDIFFYSSLKKLLHIKLIYTVHNILPHEAKKNDFSLFKRLYRLSDALIVHTETTKNNLIKDFGITASKIHIAPHGPLKYIRNEEETFMETNEIITNYKLQEKLVFSILGYQSSYKGTDLLVNAWRNSDIILNRQDIVLIVAGSQANNFIKPKEIDNIIVIDGFLSDSIFDDLMKISDVIVLPYRKIEQSGVLLTIVSQHKPYCTTDVGELKKPIIQENIGWIIPEITSQAIQKTLESIIDHPEEIQKKAKNKSGWARIEKMYDWNQAAYITQKVYEE